MHTAVRIIPAVVTVAAGGFLGSLVGGAIWLAFDYDEEFLSLAYLAFPVCAVAGLIGGFLVAMRAFRGRV